MSVLPHPYREGYKLTPQLKKISSAAIFTGSPAERKTLIAEKQRIPAAQIWHVERDCPVDLQQAVLRFLQDGVPDPVPNVASLRELAPHIAEDFVIHRKDNEQDFMSFGAVMLPTGWRPDEKIGQSFRDIHGPIPEMELSQSEALVDAMISAGPFERYVWGVRFSDRKNDHPDQPKVGWNAESPQVWIKLERQVTVGFPAHAATLFLIRQSLIPPDEIDRPALAKTLRAMSDAQLAYKGILSEIDPLLEWLDRD